MSNVKEYTLIDYFDVWYNDEEGWWVNDSCPLYDDINITDDATDKEIINYIKGLELVTRLPSSDMRKFEIVNWGDTMEICERKGHKPLYGLHPNY